MLDLILSDKGSFDIEIDYWKKKLTGVAPLHLSTDFTKSTTHKNNKAIIDFFLEEEATLKLAEFSSKYDVSLFNTLLSVFKVLLFRYSSQEDICVGNIVTNPSDNSSEDFINILALRSGLNGNDKFVDLLKRVNITTLEAYEHKNTPFEKIIKSLAKDISTDINPLFQVIFLLLTEPETNSLKANSISQQTSKYDLAFILNKTLSGVNVKIEYTSDLYHKDTINRMAGHYKQLVKSILKDPEKSIGALPMLTQPEINDLIVNFNNTIKYYPVEKTLFDLFEEQVLKTPHAIALRQHEETMTYLEVNQKANQLARYLVENGVNKGDNIGLLVTRGFNMIVGMYGILKAGGAYVPIDPEYPLERQEYILENSSVVKVIADGDYTLAHLMEEDQFIKLNTLDLSEFADENLGIKVDSKQLAYTIYTSGSTGRPKGVMIEHHSAVNLVLWVNTEFNVGPDDRLLFITSMCFDLSVYDIFGMLAAGGTLVIVEQHELMDVPKLKDMMSRYNITFWDSVPTTMDYLVRELEAQDKGYLQKTLRVVFMSGDWIPVNLPNRVKKYFPDTRVISLGGATEGTVWSNFFPVEKVESNWGSIPYGRPMDNNFFYILNEQLQPVPIGVPGELYIGGVGVARGYANDKDKTNYSFVKDPFNDQAGGRMYRTGDLGRMLPDLNMEFIGRKDDQVKIRGYRIELGEIESVLRQSPLISQAVVLARADKENKKRLVSYVVGKGKYDRESVLSYLKGKLPDYMVPTLWVELDSLPLTPNGKIDKKALPDFDAEEQLKDQYTAPSTESEKELVEIWQDVLKIKHVGINDNFFDLGGHSLLAVQIMTKIEKKTKKKFPIAILFKYPTIRSLNAFLQSDSAENDWKSLVPIKASGSKMPLYIVHGVGLNVLNFSNLALYVDPEQPIYGLQARGLDGIEAPLDNFTDMAKSYISEIIEHNPSGPYAIAGYSFGGFIAVEIAKQLELLNKEVKMLSVIDMDADYTEAMYAHLPQKVKRYLPKFMGGTKSFYKQVSSLVQQKASPLINKLTKQSESKEFYMLMDKIREKQMYAFDKYEFTPFNNSLYLFRAKNCVHYNKDIKYLGWRKYALKGVNEFEIPGDHVSMLLPPNVIEFAGILQNALDNC